MPGAPRAGRASLLAVQSLNWGKGKASNGTGADETIEPHPTALARVSSELSEEYEDTEIAGASAAIDGDSTLEAATSEISRAARAPPPAILASVRPQRAATPLTPWRRFQRDCAAGTRAQMDDDLERAAEQIQREADLAEERRKLMEKAMRLIADAEEGLELGAPEGSPLEEIMSSASLEWESKRLAIYHELLRMEIEETLVEEARQEDRIQRLVHSAITLQRVERGRASRTRLLLARREAIAAAREQAAISLQAVERGRSMRSLLQWRRRQARELAAAVMVQRVQRGRTSRWFFALQRRAEVEARAALCVQRVARGHAVRARASWGRAEPTGEAPNGVEQLSSWGGGEQLGGYDWAPEWQAATPTARETSQVSSISVRAGSRRRSTEAADDAALVMSPAIHRRAPTLWPRVRAAQREHARLKYHGPVLLPRYLMLAFLGGADPPALSAARSLPELRRMLRAAGIRPELCSAEEMAGVWAELAQAKLGSERDLAHFWRQLQQSERGRNACEAAMLRAAKALQIHALRSPRGNKPRVAHQLPCVRPPSWAPPRVGHGHAPSTPPPPGAMRPPPPPPAMRPPPPPPTSPRTPPSPGALRRSPRR